MRRTLAIASAAAVLVVGGVMVAFGVGETPPSSYTPPCTASTDSCRQKRIVALEDHYKQHVHPTSTPTATPTVTSTPTTTPTATPTATPTGKTCINGDTIPEGGGISYSEPDGSSYYVHNNNWNDNAGGTSVITACNYDNWYLVSDTPDHSGNTVQTYPNVHRDYNDALLSSIQSARFAATGPHCTGCIWNIGFDIWIGSGFTHEMMIWTENFGQRPSGSVVDTVTIDGHEYQVWRSGSGDDGVLTYLSTTPQTSGLMLLSEFFADARTRGWTPTTTWQVDYGVEIVDTNGNPERFDFTDFYIND